MTERVNNIILEALEAGVPPQTIFDELRKQDDPDIKVYLKRYQQDVEDFNKAAPAESTPPSPASSSGGAPLIGPKEAAILGGTAGLVGVGAKALYNQLTKPKEPVVPDEKVSGPVRSPNQERLDAIKLRQAEIKLEKAEKEHELFLAKNTLTESEQAFGRKAKDATELRLMDAAYAQEKQKVNAPQPELPTENPVVNQTPQDKQLTAWLTSAPTSEPVNASPQQSQLAVVAENADNAAANKTLPPPVVNQQLTPPPSAGTPNGEVLSTSDTPEGAAKPVEKIEEQKKTTRSFAEKFADKKAELNFKSEADIPEGYIFRKDVGNLDRSLGNILGKEHRAYAREMFTGGEPFGHSNKNNADVSKITTEYFQRLQSEIPETILSRDARKAQNIPSDFGTFAKNTNFGRGAKIAGVAGTLFAAADIANAAQKGKFGEAAVRSADLATDYIPGVAQVKQGLSPFDAYTPTISQQQIENAYKLGSPYAQTEEAKRARLREKAGAGRGIAPPSAYLR